MIRRKVLLLSATWLGEVLLFSAAWLAEVLLISAAWLGYKSYSLVLHD
jgi:hypothetical protein